MKKLVFILMFIFTMLFFGKLLTLTSCSGHVQNSDEKSEKEIKRAKFEPADGECILFVGQELSAIGGLDDYNDGYLDHFPTPGGFTMYTKLRPGDEQFGYATKGLDGVFTTDDWGDTPLNMSMQIADSSFQHMALAIGLEFLNYEGQTKMERPVVRHDSLLVNGTYDSLLVVFGEWLKSLGKRPVFLRIGYEFGGPWNGYDPELYKAVFRKMKDMYDTMGVTNVAYVWQDHGYDMTLEEFEQWYPGDEYVDWCGTSFFHRWDEIVMDDFACSKGKPLFIAEATPTIPTETAKEDGKTKETDLSNHEQAEEAWEKWFVPLFDFINENPDVVKAVSYINCDWKYHPSWVDNPTFQGIDARLEVSPEISARWLNETNKDKYLKADPDLFDYLWGK